MWFLLLRVLMYALAIPAAAALGGSFDQETGVFCFSIDNAISLLPGAAGVAMTFAASRVAKAIGMAT